MKQPDRGRRGSLLSVILEGVAQAFPAFVVVMVFASAGCEPATNARPKPASAPETATVYACDNPAVTKPGAAPCFARGDPKWMKIALRPVPGVLDATRIDDPGSGLPAKILETRRERGVVWYKVEVAGETGWVAEHLVVLDPPSS